MRTNLSMFVVGACLAAACGGSTSTSPSGETTGDSGTVAEAGAPHEDAGAPKPEAGPADAQPDTGDHGQPSSNYPAFKPDFPTLQNNGGPIMKTPVVVAITWSSDPNEATYHSFVDNLGATNYWQAAVGEYGVGPITSGAMNHVSITTAAPASLQDSDLQNMVTTNAGKTAGWPAPTADTIYAFFLPPGTLLYTQGTGAGMDACSQHVGGYHSEIAVGSISTEYAVVPPCTFSSFPNNTQVQDTTMSMSHELAESVTDPLTNTSPGYIGFDQDHFAFDWFLEFQDENGDACEAYHSSFFEDKETTPPFDFWVQRTWSNKMGPLGHDPCQPGEQPYFNVAVLGLQEVTVVLPPQLTGMSTSQNIQVKGVHIPVGQSATVEVGFYSDGPTSGPWTLEWGQGSPFLQTPPTYLDAKIDYTSGQNGQIAHVTVTPKSMGTLNAELLWFKSTLNGVSHIMPLAVSSYESD
ncbi:MAG TPA: hypothetical protein VF765_22150 [Polyangiaceae bacterium]